MRATNQKRDAAARRQPRKNGVVEEPALQDSAPQSEINWQTWWPFTRATGAALEQLNRRQRKHNDLEDYEAAPL